MDPLGSPVDVVNRFHLDSQGFTRLDRWLGAQLCSTSNQQHHLFGLQIKTYVSHCRHHSIMPKDRVIVAMVMLRFRLDRQRGGQPTVMALLNLQLASFKLNDVRVFVERTRMLLGALSADQRPRDSLMYQWLYEKFRACPWLRNKMERLLDSPLDSIRRTFH